MRFAVHKYVAWFAVTYSDAEGVTVHATFRLVLALWQCSEGLQILGYHFACVLRVVGDLALLGIRMR